MSTPEVFTLLGPLPRGRVAIEASAGTGKTYTLAGLVVRYIAEADVAIDKLLIVTFTRAAAGELRDRVRSRLTEAVQVLSNAVDAVEGDELLDFIAKTDRERRLRRLERAVVDFDSATITTIHGFAQQSLSTLGSAAAGDLDATLVNDTIELLQAVCADVLAAESLAKTAIPEPLPSVADLSALVARVLGNPDIDLVPEPQQAASLPEVARLHHLVDSVVNEVHRRGQLAGTLSFDDLLTQLRDALRPGSAAAVSLRRRFQVALIDEFQDTDPVQWAIFSELFGLEGEESTLIMVADPKQAIYAFRGANVHTYLEAAHQDNTERSTLGMNWRSDGALVCALERVFKGATFGDPRIEFVSVAPSPEHRELRLETEDGKVLPALSVRLALGDDVPRSPNGKIAVKSAEAASARDLANKVAELLNTAWLPAENGLPKRPLRPSDVAVLVLTHRDAETMQAALRARGIPAVAIRSDSVLRSPAATQWRWLLTALARPNDPTRARTAALSWFFGWSATELAEADDEKLSQIQGRLAAWSETLADNGPVEFCTHVWSDSGVTARVLGSNDGDRNITDLDHIAGLIQAAAAERRPTPDGLLATLDQLAAAPTDDPENDVTARQVESEAEAVQIMTIFVAKGLEFPVVCAPTLWRNRRVQEVIYQDPVTGRRTFDIANNANWPDATQARARKAYANSEAQGENLRLVYVALTRARHCTVVWWSRPVGSEMTGLARVLFARRRDDIAADLFAEDHVLMPDDGDARAFLSAAFAPAGDAVNVSLTGPNKDSAEPFDNWSTPARLRTLELAMFARTPDRSRRRWSFSAISSRGPDMELDVGEGALEDSGASDEPFDGAATAVVETSRDTSDLPLGDVPGGTQFGTLVHEVLERVDFSSADLDTELVTNINDRLRFNPWPVAPEILLSGLRATIETPLGPLFGGLCLGDLSRSERLDELNFELRLGERGCPATDKDIGALVMSYLADDSPLRSWAERLASGMFNIELAGHLTGSIDMVVRVRDGDQPNAGFRFVVVDYKTNVLGEFARPLFSYYYHPDRLPAAMTEHHYPLQALLYEVALHRYLRWRVRGYEPHLHLGGIAYLFVRGMAGSATPVVSGNPYGVFSWRVPPGLVTSLSDLLDGAGPTP